MKTGVQLTQAQFDDLLSAHRRLIDLTNHLEYCLYRIDVPDKPAMSECQQAAGTLIGCLRDLMFRHDQQVFPVLEAALKDATRS
jgi:hypothetical protein